MLPSFKLLCFVSIADKEWKRRFFQEKKVTTSLEDRIKEMKGEIQALQAKLDKQRESHMKGKSDVQTFTQVSALQAREGLIYFAVYP